MNRLAEFSTDRRTLMRGAILLAGGAAAGVPVMVHAAPGDRYSEQPATISFRYDDLLAIRQKLRARGNAHSPAYAKLLATAGKIMTEAPAKVTDGDMPPTGDAHDFYAIGKFSWPNPDTPDGMPYVRGDGKYNAEAFGDRYDLTRLQNTVSNINTLTLAWFYTRDEKYAAKAAELLNVWFIDPATRMNPNMNCASALPGVYNGMPLGIIFTIGLIEMTDHVQILRLSKSWGKRADDALKKWFAEYRTWLATSKFGLEEKAATNNHGTWYSAQILAYTLFIGDRDGVANEFEQAKAKIALQIEPDGQLPREQNRVEGFHYFLFGLKGFNVLANGLERFGYDLWSYATADGRSIRRAYQYIAPYITGGKKWETSGKLEFNPAEQITMLKQASARYDLPGCQPAIDLLYAQMKPDDLGRLYIY
jgi:hypothetical protein